MNDKDISPTEYAATLGCTAVIVMAFMVAVLVGGAYALMKIFDLPGWVGVALFLLFAFLWARPVMRSNNA
jgi:uncharacterized protein (DUF983 family)